MVTAEAAIKEILQIWLGDICFILAFFNNKESACLTVSLSDNLDIGNVVAYLEETNAASLFSPFLELSM